MKKLLILLPMILLFTACAEKNDPVISAIGQYERCEVYTSGGFQDFTDYGKYYYTSVPKDNEYLKIVSDFEIIEMYLDDYEGWIETVRENDPGSDLVTHYDFDRSIIDWEDYIYIESKYVDSMLSSYNIYFFDTQSNVLYYFHNNI